MGEHRGGEPMRHRKPHLRLVTSPAPRPTVEDEGAVIVTIPEGLPPGAVVQPWTMDTEEDYPALRIYRGDMLVAWRDAPVSNYDLVFVRAREEDCFGHYHTAPGGRIKVDDGKGYCTFKPSDILRVDRVMHVERRGVIVRRFRPIR
jgi:hypothetical protein